MRRRDHVAKLAVLDHEAERRLADVSRRHDNATARAGIIIGAAVVAAGIQTIGHGQLRAVPVGLALAAVILSIIVIWYRKGGELPLTEYYKRIEGRSLDELRGRVLRAKLRIIQADERALDVASGLLRASYICLAASMATGIVFLVLNP